MSRPRDSLCDINCVLVRQCDGINANAMWLTPFGDISSIVKSIVRKSQPLPAMSTKCKTTTAQGQAHNQPCPPVPAQFPACMRKDQGTPCGVTELTAEMPVPWPCAATPCPCLFRSRYGLRRVSAGGLLLESAPMLLSTCAQPSHCDASQEPIRMGVETEFG